jgi:hypothetical protein
MLMVKASVKASQAEAAVLREYRWAKDYPSEEIQKDLEAAIILALGHRLISDIVAILGRLRIAQGKRMIERERDAVNLDSPSDPSALSAVRFEIDSSLLTVKAAVEKAVQERDPAGIRELFRLLNLGVLSESIVEPLTLPHAEYCRALEEKEKETKIRLESKLPPDTNRADTPRKGTTDAEPSLGTYHGRLNMTKRDEKLLAFIFGVSFIIALIILAIVFPQPTSFQYTVFRIVLALAAAGAAAMFPGFIEVAVPGWLRAGGALAVFVVVFFYNPASLVAPSPDVSTLSPERGEIERTRRGRPTQVAQADGWRSIKRSRPLADVASRSGGGLRGPLA